MCSVSSPIHRQGGRSWERDNKNESTPFRKFLIVAVCLFIEQSMYCETVNSTFYDVSTCTEMLNCDWYNSEPPQIQSINGFSKSTLILLTSIY